MRPFLYERVTSLDAATRQSGESRGRSEVSYLAGGTTLIDLMKLDVMRPRVVVDVNPLAAASFGQITINRHGLRLGALVRMAEAADHTEIQAQFPAIAQSLQLAASVQIRNMASLGGNVLQRTRCSYFRDVSYASCNKRKPGSGCAALNGFNRAHAVLGTSHDCIATYAGDFAVALIALDASMEIVDRGGETRTIPFARLHRQPGASPDQETNLRPGELIASFTLPAAKWTRRSLYLKVRDRESYEFALASAAVALDLEDGTVRDARIALGGVATVPWRASEAEAELRGKKPDERVFAAAAEVAFAGAKGYGHNDFKIALGKRTVIRALQQAAELEI